MSAVGLAYPAAGDMEHETVKGVKSVVFRDSASVASVVIEPYVSYLSCKYRIK